MLKCRACGKKNLDGFQFCQRCAMILDPADFIPSDTSAHRRGSDSALELKSELRRLTLNGDIKGAVELYRQRTGTELTEAEQAISDLERDIEPPARTRKAQMQNVVDKRNVPSSPRPWWVRFALWGMPGREWVVRLAWLSFWSAIACTLAAYWDMRFLAGWPLLAAAIWIWLAVRWVDQHRGWT